MSKKAYIVEHLDPELGPWSSLEYACIARESLASNVSFLLTSVSPALQIPEALAQVEGFEAKTESVETLYQKGEVCLLDPSAEVELSPEDGDRFNVFLFGGILGMRSLSFSPF